MLQLTPPEGKTAHWFPFAKRDEPSVLNAILK